MRVLPANPAPKGTPNFSSTILLWLRPDLDREAALAHWRGPHAQLVARTPGFKEYRQHHFTATNSGLWPAAAGLETAIPAARRIDGVPEVTLTGILAPLQGRRQNKVVAQDEANVFGRALLYAGLPGWGRWYHSGYGQAIGARSVVLLRRQAGIRPAAFRRFVQQVLGPALATMPEVLELRTQVFTAWNKSSWDTPGVAHDNPPEEQFHACLYLGWADEARLQAFFASAPLRELSAQLGQYCAAVHAYRVAATYTYVVDGRPMLPQFKPTRKQALAPCYRALPPAPARARQPFGAQPFPAARRMALPGQAPEDVVVDATGHLILGMQGGDILRVDPSTGQHEVLGTTHGRPLGLEVLPNGHLLICDAHYGLLELDPQTSQVIPLVQYVDDVPLRFCSNVTAARDGTLWFTESSSRFDFEQYRGAFYEHCPTGRVFCRTPDGQVSVVLENLYFVNGITLTEDESALIYAESDGYRLTKLWLKGPRQGQREILADNLPGFPDNLSRCQHGRFWVALTAPRNPGLDRLGTSPAWLRKLLWRLPERWAPRVPQTVWAMCFDEEGRLLADIQTSRPDFHSVMGVAEADGYLYLAGTQVSAVLAVELAGLHLPGAGAA